MVFRGGARSSWLPAVGEGLPGRASGASSTRVSEADAVAAVELSRLYTCRVANLLSPLSSHNLSSHYLSASDPCVVLQLDPESECRVKALVEPCLTWVVP